VAKEPVVESEIIDDDVPPVTIEDEPEPGDELEPEPEPGDELEPEPEPGDELEPVAAAEPVATERGSRQFGALREERRRLADDNARLTRELSEARRAPAPSVEDPRAEADRLALMSPEERINYTVEKALRRNEIQNQQLANNLMDQSDRVTFDAKASLHPVFKKLAPEVERRLASLRSMGGNVARDVVLNLILGERARANMEKSAGGRPAVQARQRQQQAKPVAARGDVQADRRQRRDGGDLAAMERRLADQAI
jgi:hypothetical protein